MKFSEAMLKGFEKVDGRQCVGDYRRGRAVCVNGAANLAVLGVAEPPWGDAFPPFGNEMCAFRNAWDLDPTLLNDEGMPWEHIYGMAVAAGL